MKIIFQNKIYLVGLVFNAYNFGCINATYLPRCFNVSQCQSISHANAAFVINLKLFPLYATNYVIFNFISYNLLKLENSTTKNVRWIIQVSRHSLHFDLKKKETVIFLWQQQQCYHDKIMRPQTIQNHTAVSGFTTCLYEQYFWLLTTLRCSLTLSDFK